MLTYGHIRFRQTNSLEGAICLECVVVLEQHWTSCSFCYQLSGFSLKLRRGIHSLLLSQFFLKQASEEKSCWILIQWGQGDKELLQRRRIMVLNQDKEECITCKHFAIKRYNVMILDLVIDMIHLQKMSVFFWIILSERTRNNFWLAEMAVVNGGNEQTSAISPCLSQALFLSSLK